jgi:hypothetical protein
MSRVVVRVGEVGLVVVAGLAGLGCGLSGQVGLGMLEALFLMMVVRELPPTPPPRLEVKEAAEQLRRALAACEGGA